MPWRAGPAVATAVVLAAAAGCGSNDNEAASVKHDGIAVIDPWTRPTPPGVADAAIYLTIENRGAPSDQLVGARSDRCVVVTPHATTTDDDGVTSMDEVTDERLEITPDAPLVLEPNGLHLMCLGIEPVLELGDEFELELLFAGHTPVPITVTALRRP